MVHLTQPSCTTPVSHLGRLPARNHATCTNRDTVSGVQIALHVRHYNAPELQRHVVRIICMVPIYALVSWLSLRFSSARRWLSPCRECYESVVLYSFLQYLIGCLQRKTGDYKAWLASLPPQAPMWPLNGFLGRALGVHTIESGEHFMHAMRQARICAMLFVSGMHLLWQKAGPCVGPTWALVAATACLHRHGLAWSFKSASCDVGPWAGLHARTCLLLHYLRSLLPHFHTMPADP